MKNKLFNVVVGVGVVLTASLAVAEKVEELIQRRKGTTEVRSIEARDRAIKEAIDEFNDLNALSPETFEYVSADNNGIPIFLYNRKLNIENMCIPKGYAIFKQNMPTGVIWHALGKISNEGVFTDYRIFAYFVED